MINLYGVHFEYDGVPSRKYNLIIANLKTERMTKISGDKEGNFVFNKALKSRYHIDDDYSDSPLTFDIEIVKCDDMAIELHEMREIENWLFTNSTFKKLYVDIDDDPYGETYEVVYGNQKRLYLNCRFINAEKLEYNRGVVGFKCTVETDGMMLWQEPVSLTADLLDPIVVEIEGHAVTLLRGDVDFDGEVTAKDAQMILQEYVDTLAGKPPTFNEYQMLAGDVDGDGDVDARDAELALQMYVSDMALKPVDKEYIIIDEEGNKIYLNAVTSLLSFNVDSDIDGYTYPEITIEFGNKGVVGAQKAVSIINVTDDPYRETKFEDIDTDKPLVIDCATHRVYSVGATNYSNMTKRFFPRLLNGVNDIIIEGGYVIRATFKWQNRRYL